MIKANNLLVDLKGSFGSHFLLVEVNPVYQYVNGQVTDQITGHRYTVVLPDKCYERIDVRIDGVNAAFKQPISTPIEVMFEGMQVTFYARNEGARPVVNYTVKAKAISAVRNK